MENTGSAILNMMKEKYYVEDLVGLYSESRLIELGFDSTLKITDTWTDKNGSPLSAATLASADLLKVKYEITNRQPINNTTAQLCCLLCTMIWEE